jgi:4-amino-4-deoxy-L-arabinose transferase-like glycosyltransferase
MALVGGALLRFTWQAVGQDRSPSGLTSALIVAVFLRLAVGAGLFFALPAFGYDTKPQQQGYVYYDAYARDTDAYARGRSDQPLLAAFDQRKASDQYGGLLFLSSAIYRFLSEGPHRPLMVVTLAAAVSSLAVLFTWGFSAILFGSRVGLLAAWIVALYPDYVLLGSSQMREAFFVPGLAGALYGYARLRLGDRTGGFVLLGLGVGLALLVSPPYALVALVLVGLLWLVTGQADRRSWLLALLAGAVILILALTMTVQAWSSIQGLPDSGPIGILAGWLTQGAAFQVDQLEQGSGWIQNLFAATPEWSHAPIATLYGLTLPFLPAAIADISGAALWQVIAIVRALGWFLLLPPLIYGTLAAFQAEKHRSTLLLLALVAWATIVLASYRAGGDLWDNPRYRASFIVVQALLAGWAWVTARSRSSPWLRRWFIALSGSNVVFLHWYVGRYFGTPRLPLAVTLLAAIGFATLYLVWYWWRDRRKP